MSKILDKKSNGFRVVAGVFAVIAAGWFGMRALETIYDASLPYAASQLAMLVAMIMFAFYAFAVYGKKQSSLLAVSAAVVAAGELLLDTYYASETVYYSTMADVTGFVLHLVANVIIGAVFVVLALKYSGVIKMGVKAFVVFALAVGIAPELTADIIWGFFSFYDVMELLYLIPFVLFVLFCPWKHNGAEVSD